MTPKKYNHYRILLLLLAWINPFNAIMAQGTPQEFLDAFIPRCLNGVPVFHQLLQEDAFMMQTSDSTYMTYPEGRTLKISAQDLGAEHAGKFHNSFVIDSTLYMTHDGAGVVFAYRDGVLERHDRSFYHHNQYGSTPFMYQGNMYLFGGSGLFARKDFITRYDLSEREWMIQKTTGTKPDVTTDAVGVVIGDVLYFIGNKFYSYEQYRDNLELQTKRDFLIFKLDLKTWHWSLLGQVPKAVGDDLFSLKLKKIDQRTQMLYVNGPKGLYKIDFKTNSYTKYDNTYPLVGAALMIKPEGLSGLYCDSGQRLKFIDLSWEALEERKVESGILYKASLKIYYDTLLQVIGVLLFVALILILVNELKFERRVVIRLKGGIMLYRTRNIRVFDAQEQMVLLTLAHEGQISFSAIEDVVSFKNDSQSVRVKKRDRCLRILNEKIATIFNHNQSERADYFIIQSGSDDKRSRSLSLNAEFFKVM